MSNLKKLDKLNVEQLKKYKGFENLTESEATKEVSTIKALAKILYYLYLNNKENI